MWTILPRAVAITLSLAACESDAASQINRPLAQADVVSRAELAQVGQIVMEYARAHGFAAQEPRSYREGNLEFEMRLFRDDISVSISKLRGGPIDLAAYPLCVCELGHRIGLQAASEQTIRDLREALSRQ